MAQKYTGPALAAAALVGGGIYFTTSRKGSSPAADPAQQLSTSKGSRSNERPTEDDLAARHRQAHAKDDSIGAGVGVGGNAVTGGTEVASGNVQGDESRKTVTTAKSRDQLPSGGVGGGVGAGGTNARAVEPKPSGGGRFSGGLGSLFSGGGSETNSTGKNANASSSSSSSSGSGSYGSKDNKTGSGQDSKSSGSGSGSGSGSSSGSGGKGDSGESGQSAGQKLQGLFQQGGKQAAEPSVDKNKNTKIQSHLESAPTKRGGSPFDKNKKDVTAVSGTSEKPGKEDSALQSVKQS